MGCGHVKTAYDAAREYDQLISPRYAPIAEALVERLPAHKGAAVLELGAGTGLATRKVAKRLGPTGSVFATDLSRPMLEIAREHCPDVTFAVLNYDEPLPFIDSSFDLVVSNLTYVQESARALKEVHRVLKPGGAVGIGMWGSSYGEVQMANAARARMGWDRFPPAAPGRAARRIAAAGFTRCRRWDLRVAPRFETVDDYLAYRRAFGRPTSLAPRDYNRYLRALGAEASARATEDGTLTLDWALVIITAEKPGLIKRARQDSNL